MKIEGDDAGLLGNLFGIHGGPSSTFDFCGLDCAERFDFDAVRSDLVNDIEDKHKVLEADFAGGVDE